MEVGLMEAKESAVSQSLAEPGFSLPQLKALNFLS